VPIFVNRPILARFLANLAVTPGAEKNILEHSLPLGGAQLAGDGGIAWRVT
jgi:hypothetical protein